jgi:uncharacterized protein YodC (DUF2158 family)
VTDLDIGTEVPFMFSLKPRPARAGVLASLGVFLALGGAFAAGSNAGTPKSQTPVITHIPSTSPDAGTLVARAGDLRLEVAGPALALRIRNDSAATGSYACEWLSGITAGGTGSKFGFAMPGATTGTIVPDGQEASMVRCRLFDGANAAVTEVLIGVGADHGYSGFAISRGTPQ